MYETANFEQHVLEICCEIFLTALKYEDLLDLGEDYRPVLKITIEENSGLMLSNDGGDLMVKRWVCKTE